MSRKQPLYIFCATGKAAVAGILQPERRKSIDETEVILHEDDFALYFPVINEETGEIALTLEEKVKPVDGRILSDQEAKREILKENWTPKNEER